MAEQQHKESSRSLVKEHATRETNRKSFENEHDDEDENEEIEDSDEEYTSSSGPSSDEDDNEMDGAGVDHLSERQRPSKFRANTVLKTRLAAFLPQMEQSNRELEASGDTQSRSIDNISEHENEYVEMSLGLGVLREYEAGDEVLLREQHITDDTCSDETIMTDQSGGLGTKLPNSSTRPRIEELEIRGSK